VNTNTPIALICPHDAAPLAESASELRCPRCDRGFEVRAGVVCMLERPDEFYEGAYGNQTKYIPASETFWRSWPLWLINSGYVWEVRKLVRAGATVIELGCASGVKYFGKRYRMVGCDLSLSSLARLDFYERRVQADAATCIPLAGGAVDAIVSSYFWEHIPPDVKPRILKECRRVLRPGGKLVFLYDVETDNPLIRRYKKRDAARYRDLFIDNDGHLGYQTPAENLAVFAQAGFRVLRHRGMEKTWLQGPSVYQKLSCFDAPGARVFARAAKLGRQPFIYPYTALVRVVDTVAGPWLPRDWARIDLVVCEKLA
jgi:SAM-dependent methyltransferase